MCTYISLFSGWVEKRRLKYIKNYTITLWGLNYSTLDLDYQLLSNLQFRFPFGVRVALQELRLIVSDSLYISFCICTKRLQKAQHRSTKTGTIFCTFGGSGRWHDLQQEVTLWDFWNWPAWMNVNRSKFLCSAYIWFRNHAAVLNLTYLAGKPIQSCCFQTKAGSWLTSLEHRHSELISACIHPWRWDHNGCI